jgi:formylglycine-generating enzyme required for sulfatase activity
MRYIAGGTFTMGHKAVRDNPPHDVTLRPFLIDHTEVTQAAYRECSSSKACTPAACWEFAQPQETRPITCVTWTQAKTYCEWRGKRLPTEAEWERAARGPSDARIYPWGDDEPTCEWAYYGRCGKVSKPVAILPGDTSPEGVSDMASNVAEWTADIFGPITASPADNPTGGTKGKVRVLKGGHFSDSSHDLQVSRRRQKLQTTQNNLVGFRCARDAE